MRRCVVLVMLVFAASIAFADSISKPRKEDLIYAPRPEYPYEARLHYLQGSGSFILRVRPDGTVARVDVEDSTGAPLLDQTAIAAYSKWRFKPGRVKAVRVPVSFTMAPYPYTPKYVPPKSR
ncbi:MAG: energy transducer TonB [Verrucomicrobia bacterium]|nr:MAG: energy transducer TonB [Verrucomicrobiota bacterium]